MAAKIIKTTAKSFMVEVSFKVTNATGGTRPAKTVVKVPQVLCVGTTAEARAMNFVAVGTYNFAGF